jgi:hypothetical protein
MYWFGSVGCVGSWFCNSLTSRVRKSCDVIVEGSLGELVPDPLLDVPFVDAAFGVARTAFCLGASEEAIAPAPDVGIEF